MVDKILSFYYGIVSTIVARRTRKKLSVEISPITDKDIHEIGLKMDKFFESLTPSQIVFLGGTDVQNMFEEVALTMSITHGFMASHFERSEMEALQKYYLASWSPEKIQEVFILDINVLREKFKKICKDLKVDIYVTQK